MLLFYCQTFTSHREPPVNDSVCVVKRVSHGPKSHGFLRFTTYALYLTISQLSSNFLVKPFHSIDTVAFLSCRIIEIFI